MDTPKVAVIMGSDSDFDVVKKCLIALERFDIEYDVQVISGHRNPQQIFAFQRLNSHLKFHCKQKHISQNH